MKEDIIAGLDIGSTEIRLVVGQKKEDGLQIIGATSVPSEGVNKGVVKSIDDATSSISACLEKGERLIGVPINNVWININDPQVKCDRSEGVAAVGKNDGEISKEDMDRAIEAARALSGPANYEILHVIPVKFTVDSQEDIKDPVGMSGIRLKVDTLIAQGISNQIKNLTKTVYRTGVENIEDLVLSPLASAEPVLSSKQKELGVAVVNIGASTTGISVYEEGTLIHAAVLPLGSEHITGDVAIGLRCPINLAERIKLEFGDAVPGNYDGKDEVDISGIAKEEEVEDDAGTISKKYVAEIIEARVEEIFEKVDEELAKVGRSGMLPAGVLVVGGGSKLSGISEVAKSKLKLPVSIGQCRNMDLVIDKANDPVFLTSLGLVLWADREIDRRGDERGSIGEMGGKFLEKIKHWISQLMP
ncbi:MAG: cell division protein FtsA [Patescibacteria group bacterium]